MNHLSRHELAATLTAIDMMVKSIEKETTRSGYYVTPELRRDTQRLLYFAKTAREKLTSQVTIHSPQTNQNGKAH